MGFSLASGYHFIPDFFREGDVYQMVTVDVAKFPSLQSTCLIITLHFNRQIRCKLIAKVPSYLWTSANDIRCRQNDEDGQSRPPSLVRPG
jgi:hypothetical protein